VTPVGGQRKEGEEKGKRGEKQNQVTNSDHLFSAKFAETVMHSAVVLALITLLSSSPGTQQLDSSCFDRRSEEKCSVVSVEKCSVV
jgi:hypothetical protein